MHVRTFEADTIDEALSAVKKELGPDAIILKTVTNKGIKGAFKKNKIEITAAVTQKELQKKAKVDRALGDDLKQEFYKTRASHVSEMIDDYNDHLPQSERAKENGYGSMGLNRQVASTKGQAMNSTPTNREQRGSHGEGERSLDQFLAENKFKEKTAATVTAQTPTPVTSTYAVTPQIDLSPLREENLRLKEELRHQKNRLESLENKFSELVKFVEQEDHSPKSIEGAKGLKALSQTLKSLDIEEGIIASIIRKANFELNRDQIEKDGPVFDLALREISEMIKVKMPFYADLVNCKSPCVTVLISDGACGQTKMAVKMASTHGKMNILSFGGHSSEEDFSTKMLNIESTKAEDLSRLLIGVRESLSQGKHVLIDFNPQQNLKEDTKTVLQTLKRHFNRVEVIVSLSAIHSSNYNNKILTKYQDVADGVNIAHIDLCLNFGQIINNHVAFPKIPFVFFGTGAVAPQDFEPASAERILSSIFRM